MDVATVHTSEETRRRIKDELPHVAVVYVPGRTTSFNQPLDRSVMRSFKSRLAKKVAAHYADAVLANFHAKEPVSVDISTKTLRNVLPLWVGDVVVELSGEESLFKSAWEH
eukprot:4240503-Amphidinium_carterae.1